MSTPTVDRSPSWQSITVRGPAANGQWRVPGTGAPASGTWKAEFAERVVVKSDGTVFRPGVFASGDLVNGGFSVVLPQNDDPDILPQGWTVTITVTFDAASGGGSEVYDVATSRVYADTGLNLIDLLPRPNPRDASKVFVGKWLGVPNGAAQLGADGRLPLSQLPTDIPTGGGGSGTVGPQGPPGPTGPAGPQGIQGVQGDRGLTGAQGIQGAPGDQWELLARRGGTGAAGPQGQPGPAGATGADGPAGRSFAVAIFDYDDPDLAAKIDAAAPNLDDVVAIRGPVQA